MSVLRSVIQVHTVGGVEDGDLSGVSTWRLLVGRAVVLALTARVAGLDPCRTIV